MKSLLPFALLPLCVACGPGYIEPTYENVELVINESCGSSSMSCHGNPRGKSKLNFEQLLGEGKPYTDALVNVDACQYDAMKIVEPGNPDQSWLMIKIAGAHNEAGVLQFTPDASWQPELEMNPDGSLVDSACPLVDEGVQSFGRLMPQNAQEVLPLNDAEVTMFREWIMMGAPGPTP